MLRQMLIISSLSATETEVSTCGTHYSEHNSAGAAAPPEIPLFNLQEAAMPPRFTIVARTDKGRVRPINEDAAYAGELMFSNGTTAYLCLVADGLGGAQAGEYASHLAIDTFLDQIHSALGGHVPPNGDAWKQLLHDVFVTVNRNVYEAARREPSKRGMGTTLTAALIVGQQVYVSSVGDSRAYVMSPDRTSARGVRARQITSDHSVVARMIAAGQISRDVARTHPKRNVLYRSVGTDAVVMVDTLVTQLQPDDLLVLCSDGLIAHLYDTEIARIAIEQQDPEQACEQLIKLANQRGGTDNISVALARMKLE